MVIHSTFVLKFTLTLNEIAVIHWRTATERISLFQGSPIPLPLLHSLLLILFGSVLFYSTPHDPTQWYSVQYYPILLSHYDIAYCLIISGVRESLRTCNYFIWKLTLELTLCQAAKLWFLCHNHWLFDLMNLIWFLYFCIIEVFVSLNYLCFFLFTNDMRLLFFIYMRLFDAYI